MTDQIQTFHESLPKEMTPTIYLRAVTFGELAAMCNALIGRIYSNEETGEGWFISGIKQIVTREEMEFLMDAEDAHPKPTTVSHALVLPEFEEIGGTE